MSGRSFTNGKALLIIGPNLNDALMEDRWQNHEDAIWIFPLPANPVLITASRISLVLRSATVPGSKGKTHPHGRDRSFDFRTFVRAQTGLR